MGLLADMAGGGLPLSTLTFIGTGLLGAITKMIASKRKAQEFREHLQILANTTNDKLANSALARTKGNPVLVWTQAIIGVIVVLSVTVLPEIAAWNGHQVTVAWYELHPGLLFFPDHNVLKFHQTMGVLIGPVQENLASAVGGFLFGFHVRTD